MAEESTNPTEESDEANQGSQRLPTSGQSKFARNGIDSSITSWLNRETEGSTRKVSKGLSRRTRLNPVSKKGKKKQKEYKHSREEHYAQEKNQVCFLCGNPNNLSIHHKKKRGNLIDDEFYFVTLCLASKYMNEKYPESNPAESCHDWVEKNKGLAREMKLIL